LEEKKSTHKVEVVEVALRPHPNADSLSLVDVFGYLCAVRTHDWKDGDLAAYIVPDSVVDTTRPEFAFLGEHPRIRVKKLRGIISQGLLIKAPEGAKVGDDVAEYFGVIRYEPPIRPIGGRPTGGEAETPPPNAPPRYDLDSWHRYQRLVFTLGERVHVTEKIHGANARYCWRDDRPYCGSSREWKRWDPRSIWWRVLEQYPQLREFCQSNQDITVYGEVYGAVQDLKYGCGQNEIKFAAFDLMRGNQWLGIDEVLAVRGQLPWVPVIYEGPYDEQLMRELAGGKSLIADHIREGVVIRPWVERTDPHIGRVCLKLVSDEYLEKAA
jgi:RNA ligase (TIGR02306 family)